MVFCVGWREIAIGSFLVAAVAFFIAWAGANPVEEAGDQVVAPVARSVGILPSVEVDCLAGWTETTGKDPDGRIDLKVCTSPDKQIVITLRENRAPVGFDGNRAIFLTPEEIATYVR